MGRPKLYKTPEEKRKADNLKALRYYKRNRGPINKAKRDRRAEAKATEPVLEEPEPEPVPVQPIEPPEVSEEERLAEWTAHCEKRLNKMPKRISHIANGESPLHYLSTICQTFHKSYGSNLVDALDMINACIIDVSEVRKSAQKWLERYKTAIQDDETAFLQQGMQIVEEIEALVRFLEGLLCVAMVRPEDIKEYYVQGKHAFQDDTVKFIVLK